MSLKFFPLLFNSLLEQHGIAPRDVRLLRHAKRQGSPGRSPLQAWREDIEVFEAYQSTQPATDRAFFEAQFWASFVAYSTKETMFVGLYSVEPGEWLIPGFACPLTGRAVPSERVDRWHTQADARFDDLAGKLFVNWGPGTRSWGQRAERQNKRVTELRRELREEPYPGHARFIRQLSEIENLPPSWLAILTASRGVYLLTCARTNTPCPRNTPAVRPIQGRPSSTPDLRIMASELVSPRFQRVASKWDVFFNVLRNRLVLL